MGTKKEKSTKPKAAKVEKPKAAKVVKLTETKVAKATELTGSELRISLAREFRAQMRACTTPAHRHVLRREFASNLKAARRAQQAAA